MPKVVDVVSNSTDALGTTVGSKSNGKYSPAVLSAFGENLAASEPRATNHEPRTFFTGKPMVEGLGHAFIMRNYRASLAKWQTADPMGYPDGWNQLAYCNNGVIAHIDLYGCVDIDLLDEGFISDEDKRIKEGAKNYNPEDKVKPKKVAE